MSALTNTEKDQDEASETTFELIETKELKIKNLPLEMIQIEGKITVSF